MGHMRQQASTQRLLIRNRMTNHLILRVLRVLVVVALLAMAGAPQHRALAASAFTEVKAGHWAYGALNRLIDLGIAQGYGDGLFQKGRTITRYEMALLVAKALERLESTGAGKNSHPGESLLLGSHKSVDLEKTIALYNGSVPSERRLIGENATLFRRLVKEFTSELEVLGYDFNADGTKTSSGTSAGGSKQYGIPSEPATSLDGLIVRGEGRLTVQDTSVAGQTGVSPDAPSEVPTLSGSHIEQTTQLQLTGFIAESVLVDATWLSSAQLKAGNLAQEPFVLSLGALYVGTDNQVVIARVGHLPETPLNQLAFSGGEGLKGFQAGVRLGQIGSTLIVASGPIPSEDGVSPSSSTQHVTALDGTLQLSDKAVVGATWVRTVRDPAADGSGDETRMDSTVAGIQGAYIVSPGLRLSGAYAQAQGPQRTTTPSSAVQVGATAKVGDVSLGANYSSVEPGFSAPLGTQEAGNRLGLSASVQVGDVTVTTERGQTRKPDDPTLETVTSVGVQVDAGAAGNLRPTLETVTSVGVQVDAGAAGNLRAGVEYVDVDDLLSDKRVRSKTKTSVNLEGEASQARWKLGLTWEKGGAQGSSGFKTITTASAGLEYQFEARTRATADILLVDRETRKETTTSLGLQYSLSPEASFLLGYKLIDFDKAEADSIDPYSANVTTAQFTIRF